MPRILSKFCKKRLRRQASYSYLVLGRVQVLLPSAFKILMKHPPGYKKETKQDERNRGKDVCMLRGEGTLCTRIEKINGFKTYIYIKFVENNTTHFQTELFCIEADAHTCSFYKFHNPKIRLKMLRTVFTFSIHSRIHWKGFISLLTLWSRVLLEANRFLASQDIPRILWNMKVHSRA